MGLVIKLKNIQSVNNFKLFYKVGRTPGSSSSQSSISWGTQYTGSPSVGGIFNESVTTISIDLISQGIDLNPYNKQYWFKILDVVTGSYIIENVHIHEYEFYDRCIPKCDLGGTAVFIAPTPTPTYTIDCSLNGTAEFTTIIPTSTPTSTPTPTSTVGVTETPTSTPTNTPTSTPTPTPTITPTITPSETVTPTLTCDDCFSYTIIVQQFGGGGSYSYIDCNGVFHEGSVGYEGTANISCAVEGSVVRDPVLTVQSTLNQGSYCGNTCTTPTPTSTPTSTITPTVTTTANQTGCITYSESTNTINDVVCNQQNYSRTVNTVTVVFEDGNGTPINVTQNVTVVFNIDYYAVNVPGGGGYSPYTESVTILQGQSQATFTYDSQTTVQNPYELTCQQETKSIAGIDSITPSNYTLCQIPTETPTETPTITETPIQETWCYFDTIQQISVGPFNSLQECQNSSNNPNNYVCNQCVGELN